MRKLSKTLLSLLLIAAMLARIVRRSPGGG